MTEQEWLACTDLSAMLIFLRGDISPAEKERLPQIRASTKHGDLFPGEGNRVTSNRLARFAQGCCQKLWQLPLDDFSQQLVLSYERFLTGHGSWQECQAALFRTSDASQAERRRIINISSMLDWSLTPYGMASLSQALAWTIACEQNRTRIEELERTATEDDLFAWECLGYDFPEFRTSTDMIFRPLPALLREVVRYPFRPVTVNPAWITLNVSTLCHRIAEQPAFEHMPILADALEDAGCDQQDILSHLRGPGPHTKGCWALDLMLGKE